LKSVEVESRVEVYECTCKPPPEHGRRVRRGGINDMKAKEIKGFPAALP
jgi:hypothetical protein